jgi:outer membrane protein OmpA-like peptidoglycan-associated protein
MKGLSRLAFIALLAGCTPSYQAPPVIPTGVSPGPAIYTPEQTVELENSDRVARFKRLANLSGVTPPSVTIEQEGSFPVVRVVFSERVMFDFDSDMPRPEAMAVIDLVADNMRHDVPDAQLTLLGHTDAIGSDAYNYDLSMRRARNVFRALVDRGCSPEQLSTVAIGKNQPIAPNDTEVGRLLNRRVEFLISANQGANLAVVQSQNINPEYLRVDVRPATHVPVLKPVVSPYPPGMPPPMHEDLELQPFGDPIRLQTALPGPPATPAPPPSLRIPTPFEPPQQRHLAPPPEQAPLQPPVPFNPSFLLWKRATP